MLIVFLFGLFAGSATVQQNQFSECEKQGFKTPACAQELKLCKLGKDKSRCK